jgi:spore germination protein GerM
MSAKITKETSRKNAPPPRKRLLPAGLIFWLAFVIVVVLLFIINMPLIKRTLENTHVIDKIMNRSTAENTISGENSNKTTNEDLNLPTEISIVPPESVNSTVNVPETASQSEKTPETPIETQKPPAEPPKKTEPPPKTPEKTTRTRTLYFIQVDNSGLIYTAPVTREVPASDSPLIDVLNLLFAGPTQAERSRGLNSLIPEGTRVLSAAVKNGIVTLNLGENFMFNSYGAEGYLAQLRQLVYTACEFSSVRSVQILIEGRKMDFLAENIPIREPIGKDSL